MLGKIQKENKFGISTEARRKENEIHTHTPSSHTHTPTHLTELANVNKTTKDKQQSQQKPQNGVKYVRKPI